MCKELIYFLSDIENNDKADDENCYFLPHKEGVLIKQVHKEVPCLIDYTWDEPRKYASINNYKYTHFQEPDSWTMADIVAIQGK